MPKSKIDEVTIEKTPKYFVAPDAPRRIHAMNSSIKLILTVREPITRAISDYQHRLRREQLPKVFYGGKVVSPSVEAMLVDENSTAVDQKYKCLIFARGVLFNMFSQFGHSKSITL